MKKTILILLLLLTPIFTIATPPFVTLRDTTYVNGTDWQWNESIYLYNTSFFVQFNETKLNATIDDRMVGGSGDNASWNESRANALYILLTSEGNLNVNSSNYWDNLDVPSELTNTHNHSYFNLTDTLFNSTDDVYINLLSGVVTFNETLMNATITNIASGYGNASWNESRANALYILLASESNLNVNSTTWAFGVDSLADLNNSHLHSYNNLTDTLFNSTDESYNNLISGNVTFNETTLNTTIKSFNHIEQLLNDTTPQLAGYLDTNSQNIGATDDEIQNIYMAQDVRMYFGNAQEASIYYNGTHLVISG